LAIGVEKLYDPKNPGAIFALFNGNDPWDPEVWQSHYKEVGEYVGKPFNPSPDRTVNMDTYAMQALLHMKQYGTTAEQIAVGAAKNHSNGALNPNAQYRFKMTPEQVLADRKVTEPLTRSMCAPIGDGAAAALVCSGDFLKSQPLEVRRRAVRLAGFGRAGWQIQGIRRAGTHADGSHESLSNGRPQTERHPDCRSARRHVLLRNLPVRDDGFLR
jgi:acetyl-CoA acetyltransferase